MPDYAFDFILLVSSDPYDREKAEQIADILRGDDYVVATPWVVTAWSWGKNLAEVSAMQMDQSERCIPILSSHYLEEQAVRYQYTAFESRSQTSSGPVIIPIKIEDCDGGTLEVMHYPLRLFDKDLHCSETREWLLDMFCRAVSDWWNPHRTTAPRPKRGGLPPRTAPEVRGGIAMGSPLAVHAAGMIGQQCSNCGAFFTRHDARYCTHCGVPTSPLSSVTGMLDEQTLLHQRYLIQSCVGQGGMGAVYKATDMKAQPLRTVAVKEMSQSGLSSGRLAEATRAFLREAALLGTLSHAHLPGIYEQFEEGGRRYLAMDFIEGETLEDDLTRQGNQPLPLAQVLDIGLQLCDVLSYLHRQQPPVIFRDLKPGNIMRTSQGHVYLIDFGIARHFDPAKAKDTVAMGSPGYAAPEQYGRAQTTARADLYSLGPVRRSF